MTPAPGRVELKAGLPNSPYGQTPDTGAAASRPVRVRVSVESAAHASITAPRHRGSSESPPGLRVTVRTRAGEAGCGKACTNPRSAASEHHHHLGLMRGQPPWPRPRRVSRVKVLACTTRSSVDPRPRRGTAGPAQAETAARRSRPGRTPSAASPSHSAHPALTPQCGPHRLGRARLPSEDGELQRRAAGAVL